MSLYKWNNRRNVQKRTSVKTTSVKTDPKYLQRGGLFEANEERRATFCSSPGSRLLAGSDQQARHCASQRAPAPRMGTDDLRQGLLDEEESKPAILYGMVAFLSEPGKKQAC